MIWSVLPGLCSSIGVDCICVTIWTSLHQCWNMLVFDLLPVECSISNVLPVWGKMCCLDWNNIVGFSSLDMSKNFFHSSFSLLFPFLVNGTMLKQLSLLSALQQHWPWHSRPREEELELFCSLHVALSIQLLGDNWKVIPAVVLDFLWASHKS